ncbi:MAG TPA: gliding motility-associated C-terminal domain-containing protein [Saprospiraceae bacterium]|nr:gliding motility-associated C-terminal domain-containing protein [Saprospiraceae bacterium]
MTQPTSFLSHYSYLIIACTAFLFACKKDDNSNPLDGCCDTPAINATVGNGHVYVPNVFTPNGDGINDRLVIFGDEHIKQIHSFRISDKEGTSVLFSENIPLDNFIYAWDGTVNNQYKNGVYSIVMEVEALDGTIATLQGKVCNYRCLDSGEEDPISDTGCQFPVQGEEGVYNPAIPTFESSGCFE